MSPYHYLMFPIHSRHSKTEEFCVSKVTYLVLRSRSGDHTQPIYNISVLRSRSGDHTQPVFNISVLRSRFGDHTQHDWLNIYSGLENVSTFKQSHTKQKNPSTERQQLVTFNSILTWVDYNIKPFHQKTKKIHMWDYR